MNNYVDMKEDVFKCFSELFYILNEKEGFLEKTNVNIKVIKFESIIGKDTLWSIFVNVKSDKVL